MALTILDATTRAAVAAATDQTAQVGDELRAPFIAAGSVVVESRNSAGVLRCTGTYPSFSLVSSDPRSIALDPPLSNFTEANGAIQPEVQWFYANGVLIFTTDEVTFPEPFTPGMRPNLSDPTAAGGATRITVTAHSSLPVDGVPAWAAGLAVNAWTQIANTGLDTVEPNPLPVTPLGTSNPATKITAWCGAALKRSTAEYIIGMGGGHGDYAGNEVDVLNLKANVPAWAEAVSRSPDNTLYNQSAFNSDLKGCSTHTFYFQQFIESLNVYVNINNPGTFYTASDVSPPITPPGGWSYPGDTTWSPAVDWSTKAYLAPDYIQQFPTTAGDWTACLCVSHPTTSDIYLSRNGDAWRKLSASTRTWSQLSAVSEQNYSGAAIDPTRDRMLIVGGFGGASAPRVRALDGTSISVTFGGLGASVFQTGGEWQYAGVMYDEANDRYLCVGNFDPIRVYAVDAATWEVSLLSTTGTAPAARQNGIHNSCQYVPDIGGGVSGVVIATTYSGNVSFLRTA